MYRTLMVPLDGSPFAEQALPLAASIARHAGAALQLVSVVAPLAAAYPEGLFVAPLDLEQEMVRQRGAYLDGVVQRLRATLDVPLLPIVLEGEVAPVLEAQAREKGVDLVVMATHARGTVGRFWLGSVADELVRHLSLPVLLTHPTSATAPILDRDLAPGKVLLPLDGTELAEQVIEPAVALAALWPQTEIVLLRVIQPVVAVPAAPAFAPGAGAVDQEARHLLDQVQSIHQHLHTEAGQYLDKVAERLRQRGLRVQVRVVAEDQPAVGILHEATSLGAGLIALATHGRRGLGRLLLGSVADKVVRAANVPVLVRKPSA